MASTRFAAVQPGVEDAQAFNKTVFGVQLRKTSMCSFFPLGKCKYGSACDFAHDAKELVAIPNLRKTRMCEAFMAGRCSEQDCKFAHSAAEFRRRASTDSPKSSPCVSTAQGMCARGPRRAFSHDDSNLPSQGPPRKLELMPFMDEEVCAAEPVSDLRASWLPSTNANASACAAQTGAVLPAPAATMRTPLRTKLSSQAAMFTPSVLKPVKVDASSISATSEQAKCFASLSNQLQALKLRMDLCASSEDSPRECSTSAGSSDAGAESLTSPMRVDEVLGCM